MVFELVLVFTVIQSALGTFPPVINPPPIPGRARTVQTSDSPLQQFYVQENVNEEPPVPNVRDGPIPQDNFNDQGWFTLEQKTTVDEKPSSFESFDRFYPNGDPAIGPVATPMPDVAYDAQPSSVSIANPKDALNSQPPGIWVVSRATQNAPERWVQVPPERLVEVFNQDSDPQVAVDIVKSSSAPLPQGQVLTLSVGSGGKQSFLSSSDSQKVLANQPVVVEVPSVKQVGPTPLNFIQNQVVKDDYPFPAPRSPSPSLQSFPVKNTFSVPPPLPPPVKGGAVGPKSVSSVPVNPTPGANVLITDKSGLFQQLRHIWVPTSSRSGRFVTIPISSVSPGKLPGKGIPVAATPVSVSDTWVLKTDGPVPAFVQQKSPAPVIQAGKGVAQNSAIIQIDSPPTSKTVSQIGTLNNQIVKNLNPAVGVWPVRNDITSSKSLDKIVVTNPQAVSFSPSKPGTIVTGNSLLPVVAQKNLVNNVKYYPLPPQVSSIYGTINGKPCPIAPQNTLPISINSLTAPFPLSRTLALQNKQPASRIIRVNRFPIGSYYLLNTPVYPNTLVNSNFSPIQQDKLGIVRVQKPLPIPIQPVQSKQPITPAVKQAAIPVQVVASKSPQRLFVYSLPLQQVKAPLLPQKTTSSLIYPSQERPRYVYPLNGPPSPVSVTGPIYPQSSPFMARTLKKVLPSSSSSSERSSSEESSEVKKEKPKENSSETVEEAEQSDKESESELEKESSEESQTESRVEAAESQMYPQVIVSSLPSAKSPEHDGNFIPNSPRARSPKT